MGTEFEGQRPANPKIHFFFKCENFQRTGSFKVRGAFHAVLRLLQTKGVDEVRRRGVITHSAGIVATVPKPSWVENVSYAHGEI